MPNPSFPRGRPVLDRAVGDIDETPLSRRTAPRPVRAVECLRTEPRGGRIRSRPLTHELPILAVLAVVWAIAHVTARRAIHGGHWSGLDPDLVLDQIS